MLPPYNSNINGLNGIVLNQDNRDYYGICAEVRAAPPHIPPAIESILTGVTIEFNTHDDDKNADTTLNIHIVNRLSATESQDISVANDVDHGQSFPNSGDTYKRIDLPLASNAIFLRDMVLPVVFINIVANDDQWIFDYRVTLFFGEDQPYSWTVSGVILDQDHHKHMGVYNGRAFPTLFYAQAPVSANPFPRNKTISLDFVGQKLQELLNSRQGIGSPDPLIKLKLDSSQSFGDQIPLSFMDTQSIENDPPPPDGQPLDPSFQMGVTWSHSISELGQFTSWFGLGVYLVDINSELLTLTVNSGDSQTPLTMTLQFETGGPTEIQGSISIDIVKFEVIVKLTLRFHQPTGAVDLFGWVDDINGLAYTLQSPGPPPFYTVSGTFLGQPLTGTTNDPSQFKTDLISKVVDVVFTTGSSLDPGGAIQKRIARDLQPPEPRHSITKVTLRNSIDATASSWLMGDVIASGNGELLPYPNPCTLQGVSVANDIVTLNYVSPEKSFVYSAPAEWPGVLAPGALPTSTTSWC